MLVSSLKNSRDPFSIDQIPFFEIGNSFFGGAFYTLFPFLEKVMGANTVSNFLLLYKSPFTLGLLFFRLLFGVNEKLLAQHILGLVTKCKLLYVSNQGRAGARVRAKG